MQLRIYCEFWDLPFVLIFIIHPRYPPLTIRIHIQSHSCAELFAADGPCWRDNASGRHKAELVSQGVCLCVGAYLCLLLMACDILGVLLFFMVALSLGRHQLPVLFSCQSLVSPPGSFLQYEREDKDC